MTLSKPAQFVYDAFNRIALMQTPSFETDRRAVGAALSAAIDLVFAIKPAIEDFDYESVGRASAYSEYRAELTKIAAELSEHTDNETGRSASHLTILP
jgi:hypothetical protein